MKIDRNKILCPECHNGVNDSFGGGGNERCFHCTECLFTECCFWDDKGGKEIQKQMNKEWNNYLSLDKCQKIIYDAKIEHLKNLHYDAK